MQLLKIKNKTPKSIAIWFVRNKHVFVQYLKRCAHGYKAQEMILTNVRDTIHADLLALFELNIEFFLAVVTKPEKSNIFTLT